jgi:Cu/Ag efflux protein CusF
MLRKLLAALAALVLIVSPALADSDMVKAQVVNIDKSAGTITLQHGPIKKLGMDGMTMPYGVAQPAMLDKVKVGDLIEFDVTLINGAPTVTKIDKAH